MIFRSGTNYGPREAVCIGGIFVTLSVFTRSCGETFEKRPLLANLSACPVAPEDGTGVRLEFQSSKYSIYSCLSREM